MSAVTIPQRLQRLREKVRKEYERRGKSVTVVQKPRELTALDFLPGTRVSAPEFKHWHGIVRGKVWREPYGDIYPGAWLVTVKWADLDYESHIHPCWLNKV